MLRGSFKKEAEILNVIQMIKNHDPKFFFLDGSLWVESMIRISNLLKTWTVMKKFQNQRVMERNCESTYIEVIFRTAKDMIREQVLSYIVKCYSYR